MRILFVGLTFSPHLVGQLGLLADTGWDLQVFPAAPGGLTPSSEFRGITLYCEPQHATELAAVADFEVRVLPLPGGRRSGSVRRADLVQSLVEVIREHRPDLVQSHMVPDAGYLTYDARQVLGDEFPPWLVTSWGSDLHLLGRDPGHVARIKAVLGACQYFSSECHRDVGLARAFGFRGKSLPVLPIAGGFDLEHIAPLRLPGPTSARRTIAVKGYDGALGRGLIAAEALRRCRDLLDGYTVGVYLCAASVREFLERWSADDDLDVEIVSGGKAFRDPRANPHESILRLHGRSRVSIGLSISDGISTSFLEALAMGSFPIQSNTGCAREWADAGRGALFTDPEDLDAIEAALRLALTDDNLVDTGVAENDQTVAIHLDRRVIATRAIDAYERLAVDIALARER